MFNCLIDPRADWLPVALWRDFGVTLVLQKGVRFHALMREGIDQNEVGLSQKKPSNYIWCETMSLMLNCGLHSF